MEILNQNISKTVFINFKYEALIVIVFKDIIFQAMDIVLEMMIKLMSSLTEVPRLNQTYLLATFNQDYPSEIDSGGVQVYVFMYFRVYWRDNSK